MTSDAALTIGELSERTGVPAATLRSWEQRFGFPVPERSAGGQRRYAEHHVEQIRRVLAERGRGLAMGPAVALLDQRDAERSVVADLRDAFPALDVMTVGMKVMRALTYAIEDECLAQSSRPLVIGCFQDVPSYQRAGDRWRELARRSERAVVLADFEATRDSTAPEQVALPAGSPMLSEWGLVCADETLSVALVGWERPAQSPHARRVFEAVVTVEPEIVHRAATRYARAAQEAGLPDADRLVPPTTALDGEQRRSMSLLRRFAVYADADR